MSPHQKPFVTGLPRYVKHRFSGGIRFAIRVRSGVRAVQPRELHKVIELFVRLAERMNEHYGGRCV